MKTKPVKFLEGWESLFVERAKYIARELMRIPATAKSKAGRAISGKVKPW